MNRNAGACEFARVRRKGFLFTTRRLETKVDREIVTAGARILFNIIYTLNTRSLKFEQYDDN